MQPLISVPSPVRLCAPPPTSRPASRSRGWHPSPARIGSRPLSESLPSEGVPIPQRPSRPDRRGRPVSARDRHPSRLLPRASRFRIVRVGSIRASRFRIVRVGSIRASRFRIVRVGPICAFRRPVVPLALLALPGSHRAIDRGPRCCQCPCRAVGRSRLPM
jgi:hypothetical protein